MPREESRPDPRRPRLLTWCFFAVLAAFVLVAGACYQPSITNGGLACSSSSPACPSGYSCVTGRCWKPGTEPVGTGGQGGSGTGGQSGSGGTGGATDGGADRPASTGGAGGTCVKADIAGCTATTSGVCDPVCQTGCGCNEKCSVGKDGVAACLPVVGHQTVSDVCDDVIISDTRVTDTCAARGICLSELGTGGHCFAFCASQADCAPYGALCVGRFLTGDIGSPWVSVCDVPIAKPACDPFANGGACPNCYVTSPSSAGESQTVCEYWPGPRKFDDSCRSSSDCSSRLICPTGSATIPRAQRCSPLCDVAGAILTCPVAWHCQPYGKTYGYCVQN